MNKNQKIVLIFAGALIALIQLYGINAYGLDENRGWPISFLIAAGLLFIGLGNWKNMFSFLERHRPIPTPPPSKAVSRTPPNRPQAPVKGNKFQYGIHISELDIAIESHKSFAKKTGIITPKGGNKRSPNWNCAASVYASIRYVTQKTDLEISQIVWNTIVRAVIIRMSTEETPEIKMGSPGFNELEAAAYADLKAIDAAVDDAINGKGKFALEPIVQCLAEMFGTTGESLKALSAIIGMNADAAHKKILPELLEDLS